MVRITLSAETLTLCRGSPEGVKLRAEVTGPVLHAPRSGVAAMALIKARLLVIFCPGWFVTVSKHNVAVSNS